MKAAFVDLPGTDSIGENLSIELTTQCNSSCAHCFVRAGLTKDSSLALEVAKEICAEGYDAGYRHLHLTGGEPLLWKGIFDLLDEVFGRGYCSVYMNTNGLLMTDAVVRRLVQYPCLKLSVSLQGPEVLHDGIRGAGAYHRATRGIYRALDAGLSVTIFATTGKALLAQLPRFAASVYKKFHGIERLTLIQLIRVKDDFFDLSGELLDPEDFIKLVRTVSALNLCGFITDVLNNPLVNVIAEMLSLPLVPRSHPLWRPGKLVIRANRDITLAHSTRERFGQYAPGMIKNLLVDDDFREATAPDQITCPTCRYVGYCRRNGMLRPASGSVDMHPEVPYCQRIFSHIGFPTEGV